MADFKATFDFDSEEQCKALADMLFPNVTETPEECEARFPQRQLPEGAKVTRFAPSPTGFLHFGGLFPTTVGERLAHQSGGVFILRIEDTDAKREVEGATENLINTLAHYGIRFDEGATVDGDKGIYGPYKQSLRGPIYHVFAKKMVEDGHAYPCFTSEEELAALGRFLKDFDNLEKVEALPYHTLGKAKYENLGIPYPLGDTPQLTAKDAAAALAVIKEHMQ